MAWEKSALSLSLSLCNMAPLSLFPQKVVTWRTSRLAGRSALPAPPAICTPVTPRSRRGLAVWLQCRNRHSLHNKTEKLKVSMRGRLVSNAVGSYVLRAKSILLLHLVVWEASKHAGKLSEHNSSLSFFISFSRAFGASVERSSGEPSKEICDPM